MKEGRKKKKEERRDRVRKGEKDCFGLPYSEVVN